MNATGNTALEWLVTDLRKEEANGMTRVSAQVAGSPLWIESADADLVPSPEAFASIFLLPALHHNATLVLDAPVSRRWMKNAARLTRIYSEWWGYCDFVPVRAERRSSRGPAPRTASCFTCGLDSFFTLITCADTIDLLVFAQGFDIPLDDHVRMAAQESSMREIAAARGKKAVILRTNIRHHPKFSAMPWKHSHGGALAALGHFLADEAGTFIIPASYAVHDDVKWGSHWLTDPRYSSDRVRIVHYGAEYKKTERASFVVDDPLAQQHLRVCWKHLAPSGNCSRCEKCLRTMTHLASKGKLQDFTVFDQTMPLEERLDELDGVSDHIAVAWQRFLDMPLSPEVKQAIRDLLERSHTNLR